MPRLERFFLRAVAVPLAVCLVGLAAAVPAPAVAAAGEVLHCDDFEKASACGWQIGGVACSTAVCSAEGGCDGSLCDCTPGSAFAFLAGSWSGTWTDTQYGVDGSLSATFTVTCTGVEATGVIGMQDFGMGEVSGSGTGTLSGSTLTFTFQAAAMGSGSGTLQAATDAGSGSGSLTQSPVAFGAFTFTGTASPSGITGTFDFTSPTGGEGNASLLHD